MSKYIDAEKLIAEIDKILAKAEKDEMKAFLQKDATGHLIAVTKTAICVRIKKSIASLQQEQPDVDLEKEIEKEWKMLEKDYAPSALDKSYIIVSGLVGEKQFFLIARHFYELGLNSRKKQPEVDTKMRTCDKLEMEKLYGEE